MGWDVYLLGEGGGDGGWPDVAAEMRGSMLVPATSSCHVIMPRHHATSSCHVITRLSMGPIVAGRGAVVRRASLAIDVDDDVTNEDDAAFGREGIRYELGDGHPHTAADARLAMNAKHGRRFVLYHLDLEQLQLFSLWQ